MNFLVLVSCLFCLLANWYGFIDSSSHTHVLVMLQVDGYHLNSVAELDELCLCKDTRDTFTGIFFCYC